MIYVENIDHETRNLFDIQNFWMFLVIKQFWNLKPIIAGYCSEEQDEVIQLDKNGKYLVLWIHWWVSNIRNNVSIGTIFSIMPMRNLSLRWLLSSLESTNCVQVFLFMDQTTLLTLGNGVHSFIFSELEKKFKILNEKVRILQNTSEFSLIHLEDLTKR